MLPPDSERSPSIGIVVPCRNEARSVCDVLDAVAAQDLLPDQIVVVDDGSTDGTSSVIGEWLRRHEGLPVRVIAGPQRGIAAAVNAGIAALSTDVVLRLDGHCRPAADYVRRVVALAVVPGVGVAGGAWTIRPSAPTLEAEAIAIAVAHPLGSGGVAYRRPPASASRGAARSIGVDTVPFGCFRRALWQELGGFDDRLQTNEDYDFNVRVRRHGLTIVLDPTVRCEYYARPTLGALARQYGRYGWWKARMLIKTPASMRWRQLIPAALAPALLLLIAGVILTNAGLGRFVAVGAVSRCRVRRLSPRRELPPEIRRGWLGRWRIFSPSDFVERGILGVTAVARRDQARGARMTSRRLLGALTFIVLATVVLPPATAWSVTVSRIHRAQTMAATLAEQLHTPGAGAALARLAATASVLCGDGHMPSGAPDGEVRWLTESRASLSLATGEPVLPDPWGNCYVLSTRSDEVWVLSAGPNGIVETAWPATGRIVIGGDDIGARAR